MASSLFSQKSKLHDLFQSEKFLYADFVPDQLLHRDVEMQSIAYCFQPLLRGEKPLNAIVLGSTGTGKTATTKHVLRELQSESDRILPLYLNCFEYNTRHSVLAQLTAVLGFPVPRRGIATDEAYSKLLEALRKTSKVPLLVLDEFDQLMQGDDGNKLLYDLLRTTEFQKSRLGVVVISNNMELPVRLDARVRSSMGAQTIAFQPYSPQQLKDILKERAKLSFFPNALHDEVIPLAAAHAAKLGGDARVAIELLLKAGRLAERENSSKVLAKHVRDSFGLVELGIGRKPAMHLNDHEKLVVKAVLEKQSMVSGALYESLSKQGVTLSEKRLREIVSELEEKNVLKTETITLGKGKTRKIELNISKESAKQAIQPNT